MATIRAVRGFEPAIGQDCFLAETAVVIGDVVIGDRCSIWYHTVIRGDVNSIRIGHEVNIQDGAVIHCTLDKSKSIIGNRVSVGHSAIIHGCTLEDDVLIGMGAIVMDLAVVPSECIVAAGAVVLENQVLESGWIYGGIPAKKIKPLTPETARFYINRTSANYVKYSDWYKRDP